MRTAKFRCDHCGSMYEKEIFDLYLQVGDVVKCETTGIEYRVTEVHRENHWLG